MNRRTIIHLRTNNNSQKRINAMLDNTGRIEMVMLTKYLEQSYDLMTINNISLGKSYLSFQSISTVIQMYQIMFGN